MFLDSHTHTHTHRWPPRIKIGNGSIGKPAFCQDEAAAHVLGCQLHEGRTWPVFIAPSPHTQGLVYSTGSASTRQKNELGTTEQFGRSIVKGGPFFFF